MHLRRLIAVIALSLGLASASCLAQEITIAAAANLQFAMQDLATRFQKDTGKTVKVIYGSSGNFFQQIENGAPFDMFFSADLNYPKKLEVDGLTEPGTYYPYAIGKIVIWAPNDSKLDISSGLKSLLSPSIKKIAIANPRHAPYGEAAVLAMKKEGVYTGVSNRLVQGENISQAASFVVSGSADAGILALSLVMSPTMRGKGRYIEIPAADYPPIEQACVILRASRQKDAAGAFLRFIKTPAAAHMFRAYGFEAPSGKQAP